MKKRIWELDALRGLCILAMLAVHVTYDLSELYGLIYLPKHGFFHLLQQWGGIVFLLISGICVTLGHHPIRRGLIVFGGGLLCSAVTFGLYSLDFAGPELIIYFGVLHCLGCCMLLWPVFRRLPAWGLALTGAVLAALGLYFHFSVRVEGTWLIALGLYPRAFASSDYFPLLPNLGYFLLGAALGKSVYRDKCTLFPRVNPQNGLIRFLSWWGKWSLPVYLLHQPLISGVLYLLLNH